MSARRERVIPKRFIEKYGENPQIWSFSRASTIQNCTYEYYLSRIEKVKSKDNIYTLCGTVTHDILEDFYNNKVEFNEMRNRFDSDFLNIEISDYKFSNEEDKNERMKDKYRNCIIHFFDNHNPVKNKVLTEKEIWIEVNNNVFMGYVDAIHKDDDGNIVITDYKTSTKYSGKKIGEHQNQLLLYALGLHQGGISLSKIKCRWAFLKYTDITYKQKNGKYKTTTGERHKWVDKIKTPLKRDIKEFYELENWQADLKVEECVKANTLDSLDDSISSKYKLDDCYVYIDVNEDTIRKMTNDLSELVEIANKNGKEEKNWEREDIEPSEEYYCNVLCGVSHQCKYYKNYLKKLDKNSELDQVIMGDLDELFNL